MSTISPSNRLRKQVTGLPWQSFGVWLVFVLGVAALLYSVYGTRPTGAFVVGRPSPTTIVTPRSVTVTDPLATERGRQQARDQIGIIYTADASVQRLVLDGLAASTLPSDARTVVTESYRRPEGVRSHEIPAIIGRALGVTPMERRTEVRLILERLLVPTAQPNMRLTEAARNAASSAFEPITEVLQPGQAVIQEGDIVTSDRLRALEQLGLYDPQRDVVLRMVWHLLGSLLLALLIGLTVLYAFYHLRERLSLTQLYFLVMLSLFTLAAQRLAIELEPGFIFVPLMALIVSVLVDERVAIAAGALLSLITALFVPAFALPVLLIGLTGSVVAALLARHFRTRALLLIAAIAAGLVAVLGLIVYSIMSGDLGLQNPSSLAWIMGGALVAGMVTLGLLPLAETNSIGFLTEFRLIELSNPSHPLLQKFMLEAPGSYQHSLIIANLVERAVSNIGGDPLLARVGALYHDVGKMRRPQFFIENQFTGENPHDKLSPHLSFLIITSHVRDGIEVLREYKLPRVLERFVHEHHGTTVLGYFYKRALEGSEGIDELNFRYAGPRPRSKETAVLMLADSVESASRSLAEPSQGSIRALIDRLIEQKLQDDQLVDSPLNFHDLEVIANTFERMLTAILHRRISYPSAEEIRGLKRGGTHRRDAAVPAS